MNDGRYQRTPLRDMKKMPVVTLREMYNSMVTIPAGTVMRVDGKQRGLSLEAEPCGRCGVKPRMRHVLPEDVEFLVDLVHRPGADDCPLTAAGARPAGGRVTCPACLKPRAGGETQTRG